MMLHFPFHLKPRNRIMPRKIQTLVRVIIIGLFSCSLGLAQQGQAEAQQKWDKIEDDVNKRFKVLDKFNMEAVLDKDTNLVWEQEPSTSLFNWYGIDFECYNKVVGGRKGWRPPTIEELTSLVDPTAGVAPFLPLGHPFNVLNTFYWSATTSTNPSSQAKARAWTLFTTTGAISEGNKDSSAPSATFPVWCVRGGHGHDGIGIFE
jgi:hypothetical protein